MMTPGSPPLVFQDTPIEAQAIAQIAAAHFVAEQFTVTAEAAIHAEAPFRTTLHCKRGKEIAVVEAQSRLSYSDDLRGLAVWLMQQHTFAQFYLAAPEGNAPAEIIKHLKRDGVGLLLIEDPPKVNELIKARNFALLVPPNPVAPLGQLKAKVTKLCVRFNDGDRKDALRDLFELVEGVTEQLLRKAIRRGWLTTNIADVPRMDWNGQINALASAHQCAPGHTPLFDSKFKDDLHSFRGARNLFDHPPRSVKKQHARDLQAQERMVQGPRLLSDLLAFIRRVR